jgi:hypothetical protein
MEFLVFGGRFLAKRLRYRGPPAPSANEGVESTLNQDKKGGLKAVVQERSRRVFALWEDE